MVQFRLLHWLYVHPNDHVTSSFWASLTLTDWQTGLTSMVTPDHLSSLYIIQQTWNLELHRQPVAITLLKAICICRIFLYVYTLSYMYGSVAIGADSYQYVDNLAVGTATWRQPKEIQNLVYTSYSDKISH